MFKYHSKADLANYSHHALVELVLDLEGELEKLRNAHEPIDPGFTRKDIEG